MELPISADMLDWIKRHILSEDNEPESRYSKYMCPPRQNGLYFIIRHNTAEHNLHQHEQDPPMLDDLPNNPTYLV